MGNLFRCVKTPEVLEIEKEEKNKMCEWIAKDIFISEYKHHNGSI